MFGKTIGNLIKPTVSWVVSRWVDGFGKVKAANG
jgi:hypothetical protein